MYEERAYDLVLGSDVLFYRGAAPHVANVVARCVREGGCALLGDPVRLNVDDAFTSASCRAPLMTRNSRSSSLRAEP